MSFTDVLMTLSAIPVTVVAVNLGWPLGPVVFGGWAVLILILSAALGVYEAWRIRSAWQKEQAKIQRDGHA